jgi:methionyl-tRNA formyltransferase
LIHGGTEFYAHVFRYEPGADEGDLLSVETFDILADDDIRTVQMKERVVFNRIMDENISNILTGEAELKSQKDEGSTYFPKRTPEDGLLNWNQCVEDIDNFVRALTEPYPGAFGYVNGHKIFVWSGQLFDTQLSYDEDPGTIVETFTSGEFVVVTETDPFIVKEYESSTGWCPSTGESFSESSNQSP